MDRPGLEKRLAPNPGKFKKFPKLFFSFKRVGPTTGGTLHEFKDFAKLESPPELRSIHFYLVDFQIGSQSLARSRIPDESGKIPNCALGHKSAG
jgi:hypothetical protein